MKLKYLADENIPRLVVSFLQKKNVKIDSCSTIKKGMTDKEILAYAHQNNMIIITFDKDFGQLVFKEKLKTKGVILLRFVPSSIDKITSILLKLLLDEKYQLLSKFSVVHEKHIRIVSLPSEEK